MILTIFTPTYNRAKFLPKIYDSLLSQKYYDFEWLIIDDGSIDNTKSVVEKILAKSFKFPIRYVYKENGGKHTAINLAAKEANGKFILWLDSDDRILQNSLSPFMDKLRQVESLDDISAVVGLRLGENMKPLGSYAPTEDIDVKFLNFVTKKRVRGDYSWAIKKEILCQYPYPVYPGEKFCTEGVVLNRISEKYKTRFVNIPVIIGDYISGGLTDHLHRLTRENPLGYLTYYKDVIGSTQVNFLYKLKPAVLYWNQRWKSAPDVPLELNPNLFLNLMKLPSWIIIKLRNLLFRK